MNRKALWLTAALMLVFASACATETATVMPITPEPQNTGATTQPTQPLEPLPPPLAEVEFPEDIQPYPADWPDSLRFQ